MISYLSHILTEPKNIRWSFIVFIWNSSIENFVEGFAEITNKMIEYLFSINTFCFIKARKDILECKARLFYFQIYSRLDELRSPRKRVCAQTYYIFKVGESSRLFFFYELLRYLKWSLFLLSLEVCSEIYQMQSFLVVLIVPMCSCRCVPIYRRRFLQVQNF